MDLKVAVITPYYQETLETLVRAHVSVAMQTFAVTHILVADGHPNPDVETWDVQHIALADSHRDNGNTPRCLGAMSALNQGFDGIAFLDADNWYAPEHIESLVRAVKSSKAAVGIAGRVIAFADGSTLAQEDPEDQDGSHVDTSCYFFTPDAARIIPLWAMMDKPLSPVGDRVIWEMIKFSKLPYVRTGKRTMFFETNYGEHFRLAGKPQPDGLHDPDPLKLVAAYSPHRQEARTIFRVDYVLQTQDGDAKRSEHAG